MGQDLLTVEASRSHSNTPHSVEHLCTSDQSDAETHALDSAATGINTASASAAATTTITAAATTTAAAATITTTTATAAAATTTTTTHSFILISYDRSTSSSKASSPQIAI